MSNDHDFSGFNLITGFHGIGACGFITVRHIVESLKCERIGFIETEMLPALVSLENNRLILPFELYMYEKNVIFLPRFQPYRAEQRIIARNISNWAIENNFKQAFLIGGLDSKFKKDGDNNCRIVPTSAATDLIKDHDNITLLEKGLFVTGPLALFLSYFEIQNFAAIAILPYSNRERPDPRASAEAIKTLGSFIDGLQIDIESLLKDAERIEAEIEEIFLQGENDEGSSEKHRMYI